MIKSPKNATKSRKLTLDRTTLRVLATTQLDAVAGGTAENTAGPCVESADYPCDNTRIL